MAFIPAASGQPVEGKERCDHAAWCRYVHSLDRPTRIVLCDSDADGAFPVYRKPTDHIGPIDGLNFMSLNMTDEQLCGIQRAIARAMGSVDSAFRLSVEEALDEICRQYENYLDWREGSQP